MIPLPAGLTQDAVAITLGIFITKDGRCIVSGPVDDLIASYGILELAKEEVRNHVRRQQAQRRIQVAAATALPHSRNGQA